jgi:hypothetical protein
MPWMRVPQGMFVRATAPTEWRRRYDDGWSGSVKASCPEGWCTNPVVVEREDGRCYFHGKVQDALMDRPERKGGGRAREYVDAGDGRLVEVAQWDQATRD